MSDLLHLCLCLSQTVLHLSVIMEEPVRRPFTAPTTFASAPQASLELGVRSVSSKAHCF